MNNKEYYYEILSKNKVLASFVSNDTDAYYVWESLCEDYPRKNNKIATDFMYIIDEIKVINLDTYCSVIKCVCGECL